jgi:HD-GYP domain-containing protein (c-di-GMP phosphodiesterase class II)
MKNEFKDFYPESSPNLNEKIIDKKPGLVLNPENICLDEHIVASLNILKNHDLNTYKHSMEVGQMAQYLIAQLGNKLDNDEKKVLTISSLLHDYGKTEVDPNILNKKNKLSEEEFKEIQKHPSGSYKAILNWGEIKASEAELEFEKNEIRRIAKKAAVAAISHHEFQSNPYPRKKSLDDVREKRDYHEETDKTTKILTAIDSFAAMTEKPRPSNHGKIKTIEEIGKELYEKYSWTKDRAIILESIMLLEEYYLNKMKNKIINYYSTDTLKEN